MFKFWDEFRCSVLHFFPVQFSSISGLATTQCYHIQDEAGHCFVPLEHVVTVHMSTYELWVLRVGRSQKLWINLGILHLHMCAHRRC